ncbi:MAG: hypothetical protein ACI8YC_000468, partial [Salibacteraceae bacterium]
MQHKIEELKQQIQSLKRELLALPSVELKSEIDDLQAYLRISTELLKAVAAFQVLQNIEQERAETLTEAEVEEKVIEEQPERESLENTGIEEEPSIETDPEPVKENQDQPPVPPKNTPGIEV